MDKGTLNLGNEPKHNYVGLPVTKMIAVPLRPTPCMVLGRKPISRPKIENFTRTKCFYFSIEFPNFRLVGLIIKKVPRAGRST